MRTMTDKQAAFIKTLIAERVLDEANTFRVNLLRDMHRQGKAIPTEAASILIAELLKAPRKADNGGTASAPTVPALGTYRTADGRIIRIVKSRESGRHYGKIWDVDAATWIYFPGLAREVRNLTPLTLEEAEAFGRETGNCAICGRTLTRDDSIARGIGPVCAGKVG